MTEFVKERWANMVLAALADGIWSEHEEKYLCEMRQELGLSMEVAEEIRDNVKNNGWNLAFGSTPVQERTVLRDIICVSLVDGNICEREKQLIEDASHKVGLTEEELHELITICSCWMKHQVGLQQTA